MFTSFSRFTQGLKIVFLICLMLTLMCGSLLAASSKDSSDLSSLAGYSHMQTQAPTGVVVVKMNLGPTSNKAAAQQSISNSIQHLVSNAVIKPRFSGLSKKLNNSLLAHYYQFPTQGLSRTELIKIVTTLNTNPVVDVAFLEPVAVPAALGFDAFTGAVPEISVSIIPNTEHNKRGTQLDSPDFEGDQGYLQAAPMGVGALPMRLQDGARGAGVTIIDVEGGWLWTHEDLPTPVVDLGEQIDSASWRYHGTAVMGEMRGTDNGLGVTGITPDCTVGSSSIGATSTANALAAAMDQLQSGDLILIELHAPGPNATGSGQFGYVPMEYWPDIFDVIRLATSRGIIVCEAAGNGYQNLDGSEYLGMFDRTLRDSGAIMCGATAGSDLFSADFSNHGTRVDLNGWGWYVTTTGYGDLQGGDETQHYTSTFSGTSSASPIVTASVASLQAMVRESLGLDLDARLARNILRDTGTAMTSGHLIGTRPNLVAALAHADTIVGEIIGTVRDLNTMLPLPDVQVQVSDNGSFTMTDENGQWRLPLTAGVTTLEFSSYYYYSTTTSPTIMAGATGVLDVNLDPLPRIDITGQVFGISGPLSGVLVTPTDQPVAGDTSDSFGYFNISSVPAKYDYSFMFDSAADHGARIELVSTEGLTEDYHLSPLLPQISEDFGFGDGGFMTDSFLWFYGAPPTEVTGGAFASWACWGVGMDGDYGDNEAGFLTSPIYNLSGVSADNYYLSFHYFSATEGGFDGVNLEVESGGEFNTLHPQEGYTDPGLSGLNGAPGWSGQSGRWTGTVFDISSFVGGNFQFRLNFGSDAGVFEQGFYIDGIAFGSGLLASAVPGDETPLPLETTLTAWPNPFNPQVNLNYSISKPGRIVVDVFDIRGHRVRTLINAPVTETKGTLNWDGRNDARQSLSSGVYFVRMIGPDNQSTSQRVVLAK